MTRARKRKKAWARETLIFLAMRWGPCQRHRGADKVSVVLSVTCADQLTIIPRWTNQHRAACWNSHGGSAQLGLSASSGGILRFLCIPLRSVELRICRPTAAAVAAGAQDPFMRSGSRALTTPRDSEAAEAAAAAEVEAHFTPHWGVLRSAEIHPQRPLATVPNKAALAFQNSVRREDTRLPWRTEAYDESRNISIPCVGPWRHSTATKGIMMRSLGAGYERLLGSSCRNRHLGYKADGLRGQGCQK